MTYLSIMSIMFINTLYQHVLSNNGYVYQSWENLGIMVVGSRAIVISVIYKKGDKEDIAN